MEEGYIINQSELLLQTSLMLNNKHNLRGVTMYNSWTDELVGSQMIESRGSPVLLS
jgi:hypothetical protein